MIIISSIVFVLIHRHFKEWNYNIIYNLTFVLPLTSVLIYSRLRYGMRTAIFMHSFANFIASYPSFTKWDNEGGILLNLMFFIGLSIMLLIYNYGSSVLVMQNY